MNIDAKVFLQESNSVVNSGTNIDMSTGELINKSSQIVSNNINMQSNKYP